MPYNSKNGHRNAKNGKNGLKKSAKNRLRITKWPVKMPK
jgi:hypothetical protein